MANNSRHNLFAVPETTYGVTPTASPNFIKVRNTGTTLALNKEAFQSEELRADRQIADSRHGVKQVGGDINFELSYTSFDAFLEAALGGTWAADVVKAGTVRRSFSFLRHFTDLLAADKPYHFFTGVELNTLNLTIPANGIVTGSFGTIGKGMTVAQDDSALTTPVYGAAATTKPFDSFTGSINEGGSGIAYVTEISLALANGLEPRNVIGSAETLQPSIGRSNLSGTLNAYFENSALYEKFINETESSLVFTLQDLAGNQLQFNIPRIKYNGGPPETGGEGPIMQQIPWQALYDSGIDSNIAVTRTAA